jgi:hypothetical protein
MHSDLQTAPVSKTMWWTGTIIGCIPALLLLFDGVMKLVQPPQVVEKTLELGYPANVITGIGISVLVGAVLYLIPRTAVLGAIVLTGYLGGAVASHVRRNEFLFAIFPIIFGALLWGGLALRDRRLLTLLFFRR